MKTFLNVKIDKDTKVKAQRVAKKLGLSVSAMVNAYLKEVVRTKRVAYATESEQPNAYLAKILKEAEADWKAGRNVSGPLSTQKEIEDYLRSPDDH